jgi:hypothetical protein
MLGKMTVEVSSMMNDRITGPIAGAGLEPCKVQKNLQLPVQDPNLAKLKQTKASNKQQTSEQARTGPTAGARPQPCKIEPNNKKQQPTNQRTSEQEQPVNQ